MELIDIAKFLTYTATYIIVVPIFMGIHRLPHYVQPLKILWVGLIVTLFFDILILWFLTSKYVFLYIFSTIDVLMLAWGFSVVISNLKARKTMLIAGGMCTILIVLDAFFGSGFDNNGFSNALAKVFGLGVVIYYLTQLFQDEDVNELWHEPLFWVSVGILINNLVAFFDVFSKPILSYSRSLYLQYYIILCIANIFMYSCFTYAFWRNRQNAQS